MLEVVEGGNHHHFLHNLVEAKWFINLQLLVMAINQLLYKLALG